MCHHSWHVGYVTIFVEYQLFFFKCFSRHLLCNSELNRQASLPLGIHSSGKREIINCFCWVVLGRKAKHKMKKRNARERAVMIIGRRVRKGQISCESFSWRLVMVQPDRSPLTLHHHRSTSISSSHLLGHDL